MISGNTIKDIKTIKSLKQFFVILGLTVLTVSLSAQTATRPPGVGNFSWWKALDIEEGLSHTELFNAYLEDLVSVAKVGYKALPQKTDGQDETEQKNYYLEQGDIISTDNPTDFAVRGQGFFKVTHPSGNIFYTRTGNFQPNAEGKLANEEGLMLEPPLILEQWVTNLFIDEQGVLWQGLNGNPNPKQLYQFELWLPTPDSKVEREGLHFNFSQSVASPINRNNRVLNNSLELSTSAGSKTLTQMAEILYNLKNQEGGEDRKNLDFQLYMVDFLLKEYSRSQGSFTDLERFGRLVNSIAKTVAFP